MHALSLRGSFLSMSLIFPYWIIFSRLEKDEFHLSTASDSFSLVHAYKQLINLTNATVQAQGILEDVNVLCILTKIRGVFFFLIFTFPMYEPFESLCYAILPCPHSEFGMPVFIYCIS